MLQIVPVTYFGITFDHIQIGVALIDELQKTASWTATVFSADSGVQVAHPFYLSGDGFDQFYNQDSTPGIKELTLTGLGVEEK